MAEGVRAEQRQGWGLHARHAERHEAAKLICEQLSTQADAALARVGVQGGAHGPQLRAAPHQGPWGTAEPCRSRCPR